MKFKTSIFVVSVTVLFIIGAILGWEPKYLTNDISLSAVDQDPILALSELVSKENSFTTSPFVVLLVPGHDLGSQGTAFNNLTEERINRELAQEIAKLLVKDSRFKVVTTRDFINGQYTEEFQKYFSTAEKQIFSFRRGVQEKMSELLQSGLIIETIPVVDHNLAPSDTSFILYGINKWANDNEVNIALHIHFNDYPRKYKNIAGKYKGFSIYIPQAQFNNAEDSRHIADNMSKYLSKVSSSSNFILENEIIIETQDLIAVGSHNSQTHPSVLVEYGYIYEDQYALEDNRKKSLPVLARATYLGLLDYFSIGLADLANN